MPNFAIIQITQLEDVLSKANREDLVEVVQGKCREHQQEMEEKKRGNMEYYVLNIARLALINSINCSI